MILWRPRPGCFSSEVRRKWTIRALVEISEESRYVSTINLLDYLTSCFQAEPKAMLLPLSRVTEPAIKVA